MASPPTRQFERGANWSSRDGKRNVVVESELMTYRCRAFEIRNLATGRVSRIQIGGLTRKFRFTGFDPAYGQDQPTPGPRAQNRGAE